MRNLTHVDVRPEALKAWSLRRDPFNWLPERPADYFFGNDMASIDVAIWTTLDLPGICAITGEVGSGKSSAVRRFVETHLVNKKGYVVSWVDVPQLRRIDSGHILQQICFDFSGDFQTGAGMMKQAQAVRTLVEEYRDEGVRPVVIIEDAHLMGVQPLRDLKLIWELRRRIKQHLAIILVGQPELRTKLSRQDVRQLGQRCRVHQMLGLSSDMPAYVGHRFKKCGRESTDVFERDAIRELVAHPGISTPLEVNAICALAMNFAWKQGDERVGSECMFTVLSAQEEEHGREAAADPASSGKAAAKASAKVPAETPAEAPSEPQPAAAETVPQAGLAQMAVGS